MPILTGRTLRPPPVLGLLAIVAMVLLTGCRPDMVAWRIHLAEPRVRALDGIWAVELRADSGEFGRPSGRARAAGVVAIVLNRERVTTSWFGEPPVAFGSYDLRLDTLGVATGDVLGTPDVWVMLRQDSLVVVLSPRAKWPITLTGVWRGDSIAGRWQADQRAGPSGIGDFVLRRR